MRVDERRHQRSAVKVEQAGAGIAGAEALPASERADDAVFGQHRLPVQGAVAHGKDIPSEINGLLHAFTLLFSPGVSPADGR